VKWKLWYADGSTFCDQDGDFADAPHLGALVLATEDPDVGRELDWGPRGEFFAWWPGKTKPWGFDRTGILDYLLTQDWPETTRLADLSLDAWRTSGVKVGRSVDNHEWQAILATVIADDYLPLKSATNARELT
jgi:hypothetical protein